jgi:aminoglycoside phosphotransferase (APT) family kinase protein
MLPGTIGPPTIRRMRTGDDVVGFDAAMIEAWLPTVADVTPPLQWERLPGGHSNLTYQLTDANGREMVIRRPPQGELLPKAHDMWREFRIIDGLWPTAVPVAEPIAYCDDRAVAETHFYVMGKATGEALYTGKQTAAFLTSPDSMTARRHAGEVFIDTLAALHSVDPAAVGLAELGRPDQYVARQIKTWYGSWTASSPIAGHDDPRMHELHDLLVGQIPEQGPARIVHGDFSPHNNLFSEAGDITAVLDWELATLGDPLADFAYSLNAWVEAGDAGVYGTDPPTALPGFPSRAELCERYATATGADLGRLDYYRAYNYFKTAGILIGVYARYVAGQKSTEGVDLPMILSRAGGSVDLAWDASESLRG